jgi:hypothetical protein
MSRGFLTGAIVGVGLAIVWNHYRGLPWDNH